MTKRDTQAREYAAESYERTPAKRGVSDTFDLISDATEFLLDMATRRVARTHFEGCRKNHVECLVAALVDGVTRLRDATLTDEELAAIEWYAGYGRDGLHSDTLRKLLERTKCLT